MRIVVPFAMGIKSVIRPVRTRPPQSANDAIRHHVETPRNAPAAASTCVTTLMTLVTREREADSLPEGVIGSIIFMKVLGVSATENLTGVKGLIGDGAMMHKSKPVHVSSEGLLKDLLARCDIFVFRQATSAAASANPFVTDAIRPEAGKTLGMLRDVRNLRGTAMGTNYPLLPLDAYEGMSNKASANGSIGAQLSASRLKIWRSACMIAVNNSLHSCAEGRAYGPSQRLIPQK